MKTASEVKRYFDTRYTPNPARAAVWREIARYVEADLADRRSLLELGCGYGDFVNQVDVADRIAVDLNDAVGPALAPGIRFIAGDCTDLAGLADHGIANVFASNLLEHLTREALETLLSEIRRVLRPGGRLLLIQPNYRLCSANYFDDYTHISIFSDVSLRGFLEAHDFRIVKCIPGLLPFSMNSALPKHPWLVRMYLRSPFRPMAKQMYIVAETTR